MKLQAGKSTIRQEYDKFVLRYYKKVMQKTKDALLQQQKGVKKSPPHVESGTPPAPGREEGESRTEKARKIASNTKGSDDDIDAMIDALLPEGDPIYRTD
jgi:hypothetical protein